MTRLPLMAAVVFYATLAVGVTIAPAPAATSTDHHRTLTVYWDFQPKQTEKVQILPTDYVTVYKVHPKQADSTYEVEVKRNGVTVFEREYPATFRYISLTHDCNLSCLPGDGAPR